MSIRAHKFVVVCDYDNAFFNFWHDKEIVELLVQKGYTRGLDEDGCGFVKIPLKDVMEMSEWTTDMRLKRSLLKDVEWAKNRGDESITYSFF